MRDGLGREINYMRLSITDRCNLRCRYCMPPEGVPPLPHDQVLRYEELLEVAAAAVTLVRDGRTLASSCGEVQFTDYGISGIPVFSSSPLRAITSRS